MDKILNLQVSLFGRFIDIKPKTDIILKLLTNLQEEAFIPGTVDLAVLDPMTKKITTDSRIQMISQNKAWSIVFLEERIDFNYNFQPDTMSIKKIADKIEINIDVKNQKRLIIKELDEGNVQQNFYSKKLAQHISDLVGVNGNMKFLFIRDEADNCWIGVLLPEMAGSYLWDINMCQKKEYF